MDQMTSACGKQDRLLQLRCQPGTIEGYIDIPSGYRFYGIDSGLSHTVSGAAYGTVRTAAFMGLRMLAAEAGFAGRYLANLTPAEFARVSGCLTELVQAAGPERGLFGAKITGGGSGGTVAVLGTIDAEGVIRDLAARYAAETGRVASVFTGSGPGAAETGVTRTGARRV